MEKMGTLKKKWGPNVYQKKNVGVVAFEIDSPSWLFQKATIHHLNVRLIGPSGHRLDSDPASGNPP